MVSLASIGPQLERWYGTKRFVVVYAVSGLAGNALSLVGNPRTTSVGASGAIAGLVGALAVHLWRHERYFGKNGREQFKSIGRVVFINALIGMSSKTTDNYGHLGGLLGGALVGYLIGTRWVEVRTFQGTRLVDAPLFTLPF